MADPYAPRAETHTARAPSGPPPWAGVVERQGGQLIGSIAELVERELAEAPFVGVVCRGAGLLPPLARLAAPAAVALLLGRDDQRVDARTASDAVGKLTSASVELYAIKHGWVAGPANRPGAVAVSAELIDAVLHEAQAGKVGWELDPDFGYEVAAEVPGLDPGAALALSPRLLYTGLGRAYEHAALVAAIKDERRAAFESTEGLDPAIAGALG